MGRRERGAVRHFEPPALDVLRFRSGAHRPGAAVPGRGGLLDGVFGHCGSGRGAAGLSGARSQGEREGSGAGGTYQVAA
ncbi:hypothetical protein AN217_16015 [Streptomyces qinglanensis]|uniref:Uncharacterized protein n=1 Tax=Streptomyces qinglanensis TaxID=943816 RepID=A0A1E7K5F7_9ACTN|nr:hypothetical protein AN217_16015 [Streptomyces qinglanensis]